MKKIACIVLSSVFLAGGIVSCGKTTRGKVTDDWKGTAYEDQEIYLNSNGNQLIDIIKLDESTASMITMTTPSGGSTSTDSKNGVVNKHEFAIKKDGTWSWIMDVTLTEGTAAQNYLVEQSGTWSFVGTTKGDSYKKNERILMNILLSRATETLTDNQQVIDTDISQNTFTTGQRVDIYTITTSSKEKLELELEARNESDGNTITHSRKITLEKK